VAKHLQRPEDAKVDTHSGDASASPTQLPAARPDPCDVETNAHALPATVHARLASPGWITADSGPPGSSLAVRSACAAPARSGHRAASSAPQAARFIPDRFPLHAFPGKRGNGRKRTKLEPRPARERPERASPGTPSRTACARTRADPTARSIVSATAATGI